MIDAEGRRICDKEYWSRSQGVWCGCRKPAPFNEPSKYIVSGLDFCAQHATKIVCMKEAA